MKTLDRQIAQRVEARKAMAHLEAVGEYFISSDKELDKYYEWKKKFKEFEKWVWEESPIA